MAGWKLEHAASLEERALSGLSLTTLGLYAKAQVRWQVRWELR
jgi:hypothetical protein